MKKQSYLIMKIYTSIVLLGILFFTFWVSYKIITISLLCL